MSERSGLFITFEGPEGAGKSTQVAILQKRMAAAGMDVQLTREPGGTPLAERLRDIIKAFAGPEKMHDETELLLMEAARSQHVGELIRPALEAGKTVICDRFTDSTLAYQGAARGLDSHRIAMLNEFATGGIAPDITILMDIAPERGFLRTSSRRETIGDTDRFEEAGLAFHRRVRNGFLSIAAAEPDRVKVVDADRPAETIAEDVWNLVNALLV
ncbi:MAG: dTMP kinase [Victivallaceae bacterium]|nr:dTMP kinase [Victivallaceae bacterium]